MYKNIGSKIRFLAVMLCVCGMIMSIFFGVFILMNASHLQSETLKINGEIQGIAIVIFGCLLSWISSFFMYGYGELIDRVTSIEQTLTGKNEDDEYEEQYEIENR